MKTVVITGASRGIGKALAEKFLTEGYDVIGTSTTGKSALADEHVTMLALDLSSPGSIASCADAIRDMNKPVDILINNAGTWSGTEDDPIVHIDDLRHVLEVNLIGTIDFTQRLLPTIVANGHIVNISSRAGSLGHTHHSNYPDYKISKAALNMFTRVLAERLKGSITVSSVHPGWVQTDMGGHDADITPEESASDIFALATSRPESGQFWFKGEKFPW